MPNRILKESIRESDSIDSLNWFQEVLFYRLIVSCDDYGRFDGRVSVIKNRLFPLKEDLTLKTVADAIQKLVSAGLVVLYEHDGKPYLYLPSWTAHQNVRAKRSKYPEPVIVCNDLHTPASICMQKEAEGSNGNHLQENVPVIQSNTISESVSLSVSESKSESISGGGDSARASEQERASIGLKENEHVWVTSERVVQVKRDAARMFAKWRGGKKPSVMDYRMTFLCTAFEKNCDLLNYAFEQAQLSGKENDWRYIYGIIHVLRSRHIKTLEQARIWDEERPDQSGESLSAIVENMLANHATKEAGK
jgi:hypothetical protein